MKKSLFAAIVSFAFALSLSPVAATAAGSKSLITRPALIVVHAQKFFDENLQAKEEIDRYVSTFKSLGQPVIFLARHGKDADDPLSYRARPLKQLTPAEKWYTGDQAPDYLISSQGGEFRLPLSASEVAITGGFFGLGGTGTGCVATALAYAIHNYFVTGENRAPLTVRLPIFAIYHDDFEMGLAEEIRKSLYESPDGFLDFITDDFLFQDGEEIKAGYVEPVIEFPDTQSYRFIFLRDGGKIGELGEGKRTVFLDFVTKRLAPPRI